MRTDSTGECWITIGIMAVGGAIGAAISAVSSAVTQNALTGTINWKSVAVAAGAGFVSGANQNLALTRTIQTSMKTTVRMSARACTTYVAKQIASTKAWRNNILTVSAMGSSVRFAAGTGFSNALAGSWTTVKGWFSKLFE